MSLKVFILGRPGSGKSSVAQFIQVFANNREWSAQHIYDYTLLQALFLQEISANIPFDQRKFRPRGPEALQGFDVVDYKIFDTVLYRMAERVSVLEQISSGDKQLLLIEFARDNYENALGIFGNACLQNAFLLYINLDLETCIKRLVQRVGDGLKFSHFVSEDIMRRYYFRDDWLDGRLGPYLQFLQGHGIQTYPLEIGNQGSIDQLRKQVRNISERYLLRETEQLPIVSRLFFNTESAK
jgi:hypothetical protein